MEVVLYFFKYPIPGKVKTRLGKVIGMQQAGMLYGGFVESTLGRLHQADLEVIPFLDDPEYLNIARQWLCREKEIWLQQGEDLGARMANALRMAFAKGYCKALVLGSDIPDLPMDVIRQAFWHLDTHDSIIVPTIDGGYCLIGFTRKSFEDALFRNIDWSTGRVYTQTMGIAEKCGINLKVLPAWHDVDTFEDLAALDPEHMTPGLAKLITRIYRDLA